jgi:hypothetical protein
VTGEFSPWERETLAHFVLIGREVAEIAHALRARYVSAHIQLTADELVMFSYEDGRVWVTGRATSASSHGCRSGRRTAPRTSRRPHGERDIDRATLTSGSRAA